MLSYLTQVFFNQSTSTLPYSFYHLHPSRVCHLVTSIHSMTPRPCQLYSRLVPPRYRCNPITRRRCLYCWLTSSLSTLIREYLWSHCTSLLPNLEFGDLNFFFALFNSFSLIICLTICIRIVHAVARILR